MQGPDLEPDTFGARFLARWKGLGGPLSAWSYAELQELRAAEREDMLRLLRKHHPHIGYAALQRVREVESPEVLAAETLARAQAAANLNVWLLFALLS